MLPIQKKLTPYNFTAMNNKKNEFIVIHYVGAVSTAYNNVVYYAGQKLEASATYFVDQISIWQSVEDFNRAWHCGGGLQGSKGHSFYQICTNNNSIGIEMCVKKTSAGKWYFEPETVQNTIELVQYLMKKYNIPINKVIRHYDVTGKICPEPYVNDESVWNDFKNRVLNGTSIPIKPEEIIATGIVDTDTLNIRSGAGTGFDKVGTLSKNDKVWLNEISNNWGRIVQGWISMDYIKLDPVQPKPEPVPDHWAQQFLDNLITKGIIQTPEAWTDFDSPVTKALVVALLDKLTGGTWKSEEADPNIHWAQPNVISLCGKGLITDITQWNTKELLETNISKALLLALVCNFKGGILKAYKDRTPDHWARNCLDSLCDYGTINTPSAWTDFEAEVSKGNTMALLYKAIY